MTHGDVTTGYVDSHCHLHDTRGVPAEEVVAAALGAGVVAMIDVGCDAASTESAIGFARQFPGGCQVARLPACAPAGKKR